jgi:NADH:ubiquinone oxidoreductase subunit F (NADH-binding)
MTEPILTARMVAHPTDSHTLARYVDTGGYQTLRSALHGTKPEEIAAQVKSSNPRQGRCRVPYGCEMGIPCGQ